MIIVRTLMNVLRIVELLGICGSEAILFLVNTGHCEIGRGGCVLRRAIATPRIAR